MSEEKGKNSKKKPFKLTKNLIRLALNDGWTQKEIADKCRTQQSVVSAWAKGTKYGNEQQLRPLLEIYGHKLRRNTFKLYWRYEGGRKLFFRVEGKVILSQYFCDMRRDIRGKLVKKVPLFKLVIHHQGADQFLVVKQRRMKFKNTNQELECSVKDGIWGSEILPPVSLLELIRFVDEYAENTLKEYPSDAATLPFLLRRSLLNHGFSFEGVEEYPAKW